MTLFQDAQRINDMDSFQITLAQFLLKRRHNFLQGAKVKPALKLFFLSLIFASQAFPFGWSGQSGSNGRSGYNGSNGRDVVITADGTHQVYDLNGGNGSEGSDGSSGSDASGCYQSTGRSDERGADGGDGGHGGAGGDGGRGGDVTIFYDQIEQLRGISIYNQGGYGARGGAGSYGGSGCRCSTSSWSHESCSTSESCTSERVCEATGGVRTHDGVTAPIRECHDRRRCEPVTTCSTSYYSCSSGHDGGHGSHGRHGSNGRWGIVRLVKGIKQLPTEHLSTRVTFHTAVSSSTVLSKQIWTDHSGLQNLIAQGSNVSGSYYEYKHLAQRQFKLVWNASKPLSEMANQALGLSFDGSRIHVTFPSELFIKSEIIEEENATILKINGIYNKSELEALAIGSTTGFKNTLKITVKDNAGLSDIVKTGVKLQFVHKKMLWWYVVYDKEVPASAITVTPEQIEINVGQLGINTNYTFKGKKVRYTLWLTRTFGNKSTQVKLFQNQTILR